MPDDSDRHAVWIALSDLWLDTELQDRDLDHIAAALHRSPFALEEIDTVHWREVAPALWGNLFPPNVAGVWDAFDPDWLIVECRRHARRQDRWTARLARPLLRWRGNPAYDAVFERLRVLEAAEP